MYLLAALFFGLSIFWYKKKRTLALFFMTIGQFFNPFGYDIAFKATMDFCGGSFIKADITFYAISWMFLGLFFYFAKVNPTIWIKETFSKLKNKFGLV